MDFAQHILPEVEDRKGRRRALPLETADGGAEAEAAAEMVHNWHYDPIWSRLLLKYWLKIR